MEDFVVIGYTLSDRPRRLFSSLLLGLNDSGEPRHVGRVGTGFDDRELERLARLMVPLRRDTPPVRKAMPGQRKRDLRWIVAQVRYTGASVAFNVGGILGGALAPIISQWLADNGGLFWVGFYLSAAAAVSFAGLWFAGEGRSEQFSIQARPKSLNPNSDFRLDER